MAFILLCFKNCVRCKKRRYISHSKIKLKPYHNEFDDINLEEEDDEDGLANDCEQKSLLSYNANENNDDESNILKYKNYLENKIETIDKLKQMTDDNELSFLRETLDDSLNSFNQQLKALKTAIIYKTLNLPADFLKGFSINNRHILQLMSKNAVQNKHLFKDNEVAFSLIKQIAKQDKENSFVSTLTDCSNKLVENEEQYFINSEKKDEYVSVNPTSRDGLDCTHQKENMLQEQSCIS